MYTSLENPPKPYLKESYISGTSWYRIYSDGWCEQGGQVQGQAYNSTTQNVTLLKSYKNTSYTVTSSAIEGSNYMNGSWIGNKTTTGFVLKTGIPTTATSKVQSDWTTAGYI